MECFIGPLDPPTCKVLKHVAERHGMGRHVKRQTLNHIGSQWSSQPYEQYTFA